MPTSTWVSPRFPRVKQEFDDATEKILNKNVPQKKSLAIKKVSYNKKIGECEIW